jgi:hypothetical protein
LVGSIVRPHAGIRPQRGEQFSGSFINYAPNSFTMNPLYQAASHLVPIVNKRAWPLENSDGPINARILWKSTFSIVWQKYPMLADMFYPGVLKRVCRPCAIVAVALILPALAYAGTDDGKGNNGQNNGQQNGHHHHKDPKDPPAVPEVNPIWLLLPISGAVMLLSWRQISRPRHN